MHLAMTSILLYGCGNSDQTELSSAPEAISEAKQAIDSLDGLKSRADRGDAEAQLLLSGKYKDGEGVEKNEGLSDEYLNKAAALNHPEAFVRLGDRSSMALWLTDFSEMPGTSEEKLRTAREHYKDAVRHYRRASELGHVVATTDWGILTLIGMEDVAKEFGVPLSSLTTDYRSNPSAAIPILEKAAEKQDARAMVALYRIYAENRWGYRNQTDAIGWLAKMNAVSDAKTIGRIGSTFYYGTWSDEEEYALTRWMISFPRQNG